MRFFFYPQTRKYILLPAILVFTITYILQLNQVFFMTELSKLAIVKNQLGYSTVFFAQNTFTALRILFSLLYALAGSLSGLLFYRFRNRKTGYPVLLSNAFKIITGTGFLFLVFLLLHSEIFAADLTALLNINRILPPGTRIAENISHIFKPPIPISDNNNNSYSNKTTYPNQNSFQQPQNENATQTVQDNENIINNQPPPRMATATELFNELNSYRQKNGINPLQWDNELTAYSQQRADLYARLGKTDKHAGFNSDTENGLNYKFKFFGLGENSGYGATGDAHFLIDNWYGSSAPHNSNQLNPDWTHVGIGVNSSATNFIFGGGKTESFHLD